MAPLWEISPAPPSFEGKALFMDAVLRPHRSLSLAAFRLMLLAAIAVNIIIAAAFMAQGAYPVAGFLGLDVLALWVAFRVNYHAARREERVRVAAEKLHLERREPNGGARHWVLNPLWAQVSEDEGGVRIRGGAGAMRVGAFLSPRERGEFAAALRAALFRAKRGY